MTFPAPRHRAEGPADPPAASSTSTRSASNTTATRRRVTRPSRRDSSISAARPIRRDGAAAMTFPPSPTGGSARRPFRAACRRAFPASPSIPAAPFARRRVREALASMFDFEWIHANLRRRLHASEVSSTTAELVVDRPTCQRARAGFARALSGRGARRRDGRRMARPGLRRFRPRPRDRQERARGEGRRRRLRAPERPAVDATWRALAFEILVKNRDEERLALSTRAIPPA